MCAQRRLRSAWASAQSAQSLLCALNGYLKTQAFFMWTAKTDQTGRMLRLIWVFAGYVGFVMKQLICQTSFWHNKSWLLQTGASLFFYTDKLPLISYGNCRPVPYRQVDCPIKVTLQTSFTVNERVQQHKGWQKLTRILKVQCIRLSRFSSPSITCLKTRTEYSSITQIKCKLLL